MAVNIDWAAVYATPPEKFLVVIPLNEVDIEGRPKSAQIGLTARNLQVLATQLLMLLMPAGLGKFQILTPDGTKLLADADVASMHEGLDKAIALNRRIQEFQASIAQEQERQMALARAAQDAVNNARRGR